MSAALLFFCSSSSLSSAYLPVVTHLSSQQRSDNPYLFAYPLTDPSPDAPACRSRRGEAPEGSSFFSPRVEARSAEDRGERMPFINLRPRQGVALTSQAISATPSRGRDRYGCLVHGSSGLRPSTTWLGSGHPQGVLRSTRFINGWSGFSTAQMHRLCCEGNSCIASRWSLDPCFNGIWSVRGRGYSREDLLCLSVLILVLMEYGLRVDKGYDTETYC